MIIFKIRLIIFFLLHCECTGIKSQTDRERQQAHGIYCHKLKLLLLLLLLWSDFPFSLFSPLNSGSHQSWS